MKHVVLRFASVGLMVLLAFSPLGAQQTPRSGASSVSRVGCQSCPASLRIIADMDCSVSVDGEKVGRMAQDSGKTVEVALGEHIVVAQAGELKWQTTLTVDKPGQRLIKTDLHSTQKAIEGLKPWQGDWYGQIYYQQQPMSSITLYYFQSFEIKVEGQRCTIIRRFGSASGPPLPASYKISPLQPTTCSADKDGFVTDGIVKAALEGNKRTLTFEDWNTHETYSLSLVDAASARQGNADLGEDPLKAGAQAWAGEWEGEADWRSYASSGDSYGQYHVDLTISVGNNGSCSATKKIHYSFRRADGSRSDVIPDEDHTSQLDCGLIDSRRLHIEAREELPEVVQTSASQAQVSYRHVGEGAGNVLIRLRRTR